MATVLSPAVLASLGRNLKTSLQLVEKFDNLGPEILSDDDVSVRVVRDVATGKQMAVKRCELNKRTLFCQVEQELSVLLNLQHPCITRLCEVYIHGSQLYQVFEYAEGSSLLAFVDKRLLSEPQCRYLFQQLAAAVEFCHSQGASGRDLKLENILLTKLSPPEVKLADPATAKPSPFADIGCPGSIYAAPEQLKTRHAKGVGTVDGRTADVWSLGVILAAILFHAYPFADPEDPKNINRIFENIALGRYFMPATVSLSSDCKDLLARIFVVDPKKRITLPQLRRHPWFLRDLPRKLAMPYKPLENAPLRFQAARVIEMLRERRVEQTREAVQSYIV